MADALAPRAAFAADAPGHVSAPLRPKGTDDGQERGQQQQQQRGEVYGQVPGAPPPQAAGTQFFAMDVDEVPAAGGSRPDRLAPVSGPQERVQRHFVEQLVVAAPGLPTLDALVPLVVEQLADVLSLVEAMEKEEDAKMGQVEDMMFSGQSVSAADREAWRRWAQAGSTQRTRKRKKKKMLPKTSLRHAAPVPAVLRRVRGGASVPVHRQSGGYFSCFTETGLTVQNCAEDRRFARCSSWNGWDTPVVVQRQAVWCRQCRNCGSTASAVL